MARVQGCVCSEMSTTIRTAECNMTNSEPSTSQDMHSTSEDEFSQKCPICLDIMKDQKVGKVMFCEHLFCASCIMEWLNKNSTCPSDRQYARCILVYRNMKRVNGIQYSKSVKRYHVNCTVCHLLIKDHEFVLCGSCRIRYHIHCITPTVKNMKAYDPYTCQRCMQIPNHRPFCSCLRCDSAAKCKQGQGKSKQQKLQHGPRSL